VTPALIRGHCRGVTRSRYLRGTSRRRQSAIIRPTTWIWRLRMSCGVMSATRVQIISASCVLSKIDVESQAQRTPLPAVHCSASRYLPSGGGKSSPSVFFRDDLATPGPGTADLCSKTPNFITISVPWNLYPPPPFSYSRCCSSATISRSGGSTARTLSGTCIGARGSYMRLIRVSMKDAVYRKAALGRRIGRQKVPFY
jgi:hypothetical protein